MQPNTNPIRLARDRAGLTQVTLSLRAGLSLSTIRNAERGIATWRTLTKIACVLGVTVDVLSGRAELEQAGALKVSQVVKYKSFNPKKLTIAEQASIQKPEEK